MKYEIQLVKKSTINFVTYKYHGNRQLKPALMHLFNKGTIPFQEE